MKSDALKAYQEAVARGEVEKVAPRNPAQRFLDKQTLLRAVGAMCMQCMGTDDPDNPQPGYRSDIRGCTATTCPLYAWRPYK